MLKDGKVKVSKMIKLLSSYPQDAEVRVEVTMLNDVIPDWTRTRILSPKVISVGGRPVISVQYYDDDPWTEV